MTTKNVNNIMKLYSLATPSEIEDGKVWYARAQADCLTIAETHNVPLAIVVGVVAALSPNNKWERNVVNADSLIQGFLNGDAKETIKVSTYHAMKDKAWSILEAMPVNVAEIVAILNGQKIVAFFRCIMGENTCCVDGHAYNIWRFERIGLTSDKVNVPKKLYNDIAIDYGKAAIKAGLKAYEMQAITWTVWRRVHNIK